MDNLATTTAAIFHEELRINNISITRAASAIGVMRQTLSGWLQGHQEIPLTKAYALARIIKRPLAGIILQAEQRLKTKTEDAPEP